MTDTKPKKRVHWLVWTLPTLLLIVAPMANHFLLFQLFRQPSGSMQPTLMAGDMFAVSKWSYGYTPLSFGPFSSLLPEGRWLAHDPQAGDIIVFEPVPEPGRHFV